MLEKFAMNYPAVVLALLASACIADLTGTGDDDAPDDPPPPPPASRVQLTVKSNGVPQAGLVVIFQRADDSLVAEVTTDAMGLASAPMPVGGNVTVIRNGQLGEAFTYVGAKAGDKLELAVASKGATPTTIKVRVPEPEVEGSPVSVSTPCGSALGAAPIVELTLDGGCGPETDFYVVDIEGTASDDELPRPLSVLERRAIAPEVDLSNATLRENLTSMIAATNLPGIEGLAIVLEQRLETNLFRPVFASGQIAAETAAIDSPDLPGIDMIVAATLSFASGKQVIATGMLYTPAPPPLDIASSMIAQPKATSLGANGVTWTEESGSAPDFVFTQLATANVRRVIAAPYAGTTLRVPQLPATYAAYNITASEAPTIDHHLVKITGGYDGVRPQVFNIPLGSLAPRNGKITIASASSERPTP
ncbi:MAG: hypothetical protein M4D80_33540 [Myxococcota bacterium]|nr:hypothetical protein [Myxococcota bacterium]